MSHVPARFLLLRCGPRQHRLWFNVAEIVAVAEPVVQESAAEVPPIPAAVMLSNGREFSVADDDWPVLLSVLTRLEAH